METLIDEDSVANSSLEASSSNDNNEIQLTNHDEGCMPDNNNGDSGVIDELEMCVDKLSLEPSNRNEELLDHLVPTNENGEFCDATKLPANENGSEGQAVPSNGITSIKVSTNGNAEQSKVLGASSRIPRSEFISRAADSAREWSAQRSATSRPSNGTPDCGSAWSRRDPGQMVGKYQLLKTIGKGNFARVKLALHLPTGRHVAIKIIDKTRLNPSNLQKLFREVRVMKTLEHPNIVKLYEVIESERSLYLVMEYASRGEIFDYLVNNGRLKERDVRAKFRQIVSAVQYCHRKSIVHRDLKAENLLLDADLNIKIADFGFSNEFTPGNKLDTFCGSPPYAAPELFQGKKYDGPEVDVWSLGVILYTLTSGSLPFDGRDLKELRERIVRGKYRVPFYMSTDCETLLKKLLVINPTKRATLEHAMKDRWLNAGHENDPLIPHEEPRSSMDEARIDMILSMGFSRQELEEALAEGTYNDVSATYHLLGQRLSALDHEVRHRGGSSASVHSSGDGPSRGGLGGPATPYRPTADSTPAMRTRSHRGRPHTSFVQSPPRVQVPPPRGQTPGGGDQGHRGGRPMPSHSFVQSQRGATGSVRTPQQSNAAPQNSITVVATQSFVSTRGAGGRSQGGQGTTAWGSGRSRSRGAYNTPGGSQFSRGMERGQAPPPRSVSVAKPSSLTKRHPSFDSDSRGSNDLFPCLSPVADDRQDVLSTAGSPGTRLVTSAPPRPATSPPGASYVAGRDKPQGGTPEVRGREERGAGRDRGGRARSKGPVDIDPDLDADLADPTSPWSSAAVSQFRQSVHHPPRTVSSTPPSQQPPHRPLGRHQPGRVTVHGTGAGVKQQRGGGAGNHGVGAEVGGDGQRGGGVGGGANRMSFLNRITAKFNRR